MKKFKKGDSVWFFKDAKGFDIVHGEIVNEPENESGEYEIKEFITNDIHFKNLYRLDSDPDSLIMTSLIFMCGRHITLNHIKNTVDKFMELKNK